ncbi:MAG: hypothetical protein LBG27_03780 [Spirochaetaceae bacterium]|nr:hypothetical protein [Spirochaetaceae bacterium]
MKRIFWLLFVVLPIPLWGQNERWAEEQAKELANQQCRYYSGQTSFFARYKNSEIDSRMAMLYRDLYNIALKNTRVMGRNFYYGFYTDEDFNWEFDQLRNNLNHYACARMKQLFPPRERSGHWETYYEPRAGTNLIIRRVPEWQDGRYVRYWVWDD